MASLLQSGEMQSEVDERNENIKMLHHHRKAKEASNAKRKRCTTYHAKQGQRTSFDSTICKPVKEDEEEKICSICMDAIKCRGLLAVCNHFFCFHCIYEWSKVTNNLVLGFISVKSKWDSSLLPMGDEFKFFSNFCSLYLFYIHISHLFHI